MTTTDHDQWGPEHDADAWAPTEFPAIATEPATFAEYLRDQAGYYYSLDDQYSVALAKLLADEATSLERRGARWARKADPAF